MKLKNIGTRALVVGDKVIEPGQTVTVPAAWPATVNIAALVTAGHVEIEKTARKKKGSK